MRGLVKGLGAWAMVSASIMALSAGAFAISLIVGGVLGWPMPDADDLHHWFNATVSAWGLLFFMGVAMAALVAVLAGVLYLIDWARKR